MIMIIFANFELQIYILFELHILFKIYKFNFLVNYSYNGY